MKFIVFLCLFFIFKTKEETYLNNNTNKNISNKTLNETLNETTFDELLNKTLEETFKKNETVINDEDYDKRMELTQKLLEELNLDKKENITKEDFANFLKKLLTFEVQETEDPGQEEFYDEIVKTMLKDIPETIPTDKITDYLDSDNLQNAIKESVISLFGEDAFEDFNKDLENEKTDL